ncbi:hypothetical protein B0H13DRAFT_2285955 [Mycena leptocephala]|nr:hypothetical protein B0H13DRAFT_2285955 [Mycena leptocephala]
MELMKIDYCSRVPTELWVRCWSHCSSQDLRRLVLVSRHFRELCQPFLFQHQRYTAPYPDAIAHDWMDTVRNIHRSMLRVQQLATSAHASSVRSWEWDFRGSSDLSSIEWGSPGVVNTRLVEEACRSIVSLFTSTLGTYQNLRVLRLTFLTIDEPLRAALASLGRLEELTLISCDISSWKGAILSLQNFRLGRLLPRFLESWAKPDIEKSAESIQPLHIVSPDNLRILSIEGYETSSALLSGFANEARIFHNLVSVSVELWATFFPQFHAFLELCPQLTRLEITKSNLPRLPRDRLAPTITPLLRCFKGPRLLAAFFGSQRPLQVVELSGGSGVKRAQNKHMEDDVMGELAQIAYSCPGVRSLSLTVTFPDCPKVLSAIAENWPDLRKLSLSLKRALPPQHTLLRFGDDEDHSDWEPMSDEEVTAMGIGGTDASMFDMDLGSEPEKDARTFDPADIELEDADVARALDFSDGENSVSISSPSPVACDQLAPDSTHEALLPVPDVLVPGYLYSHASPPPEATSLVPGAVPTPTSFSTLIDAISAGLLSLPPSLESLRLQRSRLSLADEHRAVLAHERALPKLREIEFEGTPREARFSCARIWRREQGIWSESETGATIASLVNRED